MIVEHTEKSAKITWNTKKQPNMRIMAIRTNLDVEENNAKDQTL